MPFLERDPWRLQYFEDVDCPVDVAIPTDDVDAYCLIPTYRWVYNKLLIAESQAIACGPHGVTPPSFPVFSKPIYNLRGMGVDSRVLRSLDEYEQFLRPGQMWMTLLTGEHVSTDAAVAEGRVCWLRHSVGHPLPGGTFDYWVVEASGRDRLGRYCTDWLSVHMPQYTGMVNLETIDGRIIEVHLRFSDQWLDLYGAGWLQAVAGLYARRRWDFADERRADGYSVVLFGPHGRRYRRPQADVLARILAEDAINSVQVTFTEDRAHAQAMPPGGFRLAIVNTRDLAAGLEARRVLAGVFGLW
jgi:hypothetical protein